MNTTFQADERMSAGRHPGAVGRPARVGLRAFTLVEVLVSVAIVGILFTSLYTGITAGFGIIAVARENVRATQILIDRTEEMRLYSWTQISTFGSSTFGSSTSYIPASFTEPFFPTSTNYSSSSLSTHSTASGFTYYGTIDIAASGISEAYSNDLKLVTVTLRWTNGTVRNRTMTTFVSQYGMQNYIFN